MHPTHCVFAIILKEGAKIHNKIVISERIMEYRRANRVTQSELARELGVSPQAIYKWEKEICYPDITFLPLLAAVIGCTIDEFFE